jgi:hypothetical protein
MIKEHFNGETDFTKKLSENEYWFNELLKTCNIPTNGDIDSWTEHTTGDKSVGKGRFDIFEENSMTLVEAQLNGLDFDHINRATDYALGIEEEYGHQVNNVIYLTDGNVPSLTRKKVKELNQGSRNHFIVEFFPYTNNGEVKLHFTLIDGPEVIKERTFSVGKAINTTNMEDSMTLSNVSQPWRSKEYLAKIEGMLFWGSVGRGDESQQYWVEYVGGKWVNSEGSISLSANTVMRQVRLKSFIKVYGEERVPNLSVWGNHRNSDGLTIDEVLLKLYSDNSK